jgi:hypothetical protein
LGLVGPWASILSFPEGACLAGKLERRFFFWLPASEQQILDKFCRLSLEAIR